MFSHLYFCISERGFTIQTLLIGFIGLCGGLFCGFLLLGAGLALRTALAVVRRFSVFWSDG